MARFTVMGLTAKSPPGGRYGTIPHRGGVVSKPIHIRDEEVIRAVEERADCLVIGGRRFLLVEVDEATGEPYHVTDPDEEVLVLEALQDTSPRLSGEAAREYLKARLREHGIG